MHVDTNSHKVEVDWKFFSGCGQQCVQPVCISVWKSVCVKLTLSQEWIDGMNWFFACWWKFRKAKSCLNAFWVGVVKTSFDYLANETVKPAEWVYELCWFFACWLWCNSFWLDQHHAQYFDFKCHFTAVVLIMVAGGSWW